MTFKTALVIPDCHIPYESKRAYKLMIKVGQYVDPDEIVILGDFADFYAVNAHGKHPRLMHLLESEVEAVNKRLDELDELFPRAKKVFIEGNHEYRFFRYINEQCPALFGITDAQHLFKLHTRPNWRFVTYGPTQLTQVLNSKLFARHEPFSMTGASASVKKSMINLVYGHIHRIESAGAINARGKTFVNFSPGWLGDVKKDLIYGYTKQVPNWELGFSIVRIDPKTKFFYHNIVKIMENMTCQLDGKLFKL